MFQSLGSTLTLVYQLNQEEEACILRLYLMLLMIYVNGYEELMNGS